MNEELAKHAKNNDFNNFKLAYEPLFPNGNAQTAFNAMKAELKNGGKPTNRSYSESVTSALNGSDLGSFIADKSGVVGKLAAAASDLTRFVAKGIKGAVATQYGDEEKTDSAGKLLGALGEGGLNPLKLISSALPVVLEEINKQLTDESKLFTEINSQVGISGDLSKGIQKDMLQASIEGERYQISLQEIGQLYTKMSDSSGKFALINRNIMESVLPVSKVLGKSMADMGDIISQYETVGLGVDKTIKELDNAATRTISLGLNARSVSKVMTEQLGRLNEYGFQNGIQGLERMSQKAVEFRMSMDQVFKLADNVFTPEKAVELSANLQVLGGAMGAFNDPIRLMYMATNNVEGLQDALIGATQGLATYNQEQGKFEITGINIRKAHEMANALGVDYKELTKSAIAGAERLSATTALMANSVTSKMDDKDKEFLINMSRMEGGEMKIVVPESLMDKFQGKNEIALDQLTKEQADALEKYQKEFEKMDSKKIAMSQLTETQKMVRSLDVLARYAIVEASQNIKGGANAVFKKSMDEFKGVVDKYNKESSPIYQTEAKAEKTVNGVIDGIKAIPQKIENAVTNVIDKVTGKNVPTTQTTTQDVNMKISVSSDGPVSDSLYNAIRKDPTSMAGIISFNSRDYTTSNQAHKK